MPPPDSLRRACKQLGNASTNLYNGNPLDWRGIASELVLRIRYAIESPGQYETASFAKKLDDALLQEYVRPKGDQ